jgi:hypothetical protein
VSAMADSLPPGQELREAFVDARQLEEILHAVGTKMILIGGQALSFWAGHYLIRADPIAITRDVDFLIPTPRSIGALRGRDVDFLESKDEVKRLAAALQGHAKFPHERAMTALVGQVVKDLPGGHYVNIDVLFRVHGDVTTDAIEKRAVDVELPAGRFRVMHPLDVLQGRLENVYSLAEKQDDHGLVQLELAIPIARAFLLDVASQDTRSARPIVLGHISRIESMAASDAGRKVAKRHCLHVADAIDPQPVTHVKAFMAKKLPQLLSLMSPSRRAELSALAPKSGVAKTRTGL